MNRDGGPGGPRPEIDHSGLLLGLATAARYAPVLAPTPLAGVLADRDDKRRLLLTTYSVLIAAFGTASVIGGIYCTKSPRPACRG